MISEVWGLASAMQIDPKASHESKEVLVLNLPKTLLDNEEVLENI